MINPDGTLTLHGPIIYDVEGNQINMLVQNGFDLAQLFYLQGWNATSPLSTNEIKLMDVFGGCWTPRVPNYVLPPRQLLR